MRVLVGICENRLFLELPSKWDSHIRESLSGAYTEWCDVDYTFRGWAVAQLDYQLDYPAYIMQYGPFWLAAEDR